VVTSATTNGVICRPWTPGAIRLLGPTGSRGLVSRDAVSLVSRPPPEDAGYGDPSKATRARRALVRYRMARITPDCFLLAWIVKAY